jgi:UDP-glucose:(heptosyl)LPS alpha-1,3-glucosyltransferase
VFSFQTFSFGKGSSESLSPFGKKIGLYDEIIFAGSTDEPEKYYGAADLLVHPTFYDACSLTVLEALASGLPVITTPSNGASGMIRWGEEGRVIGNLRDEEELRMVIKYFIEKGIGAHALHQGREKLERYSEKVNFDRMMGIFRETIKNIEGRSFSLERSQENFQSLPDFRER